MGMASSLMATMIVRLMDPRDLSTPAWMTSAIEQLDAARGWTAQLKSVQDTATKVAVVNEQADRAQAAAVLPSAVTDAGKITGAIKMASVSDVAATPTVTTIASGWVSDAGSIQDSIPGTAKMISGSIPDTIKMVSGAISDAGTPIYAALPKVAPVATGMMHEWSRGAVKVPGDFTSVTSGLSLDEIQRVSAAFAATSVAQRSPAYGGTFRPPSAPVSPRRQRGTHLPPAVPPASPRRREPVEDERQAPRVLPQEMGEALAQSLTRRHRQEAKGLLVALDLELELEHLESIERRLLDGGRPDRLYAALSASLLLEGLADKLFPPTGEQWVCRFGKTYKLGPPNVKNRLHAFADRFLKQRSTAEHKLFVAELDLVSRWSGKGHHVVFTPRENAEAFCALLKVLATAARTHRLS